MSKHTPGPWIECAESGDWWIQRDNPEDPTDEPTRPILLGVALFVAVALLALFGLTAEARYLGALLIALPAVGACWV